MDESVKNILPPPLFEKWTKYLDKRNRGLKKESNQALMEVILYLDSEDKESLHQFAIYLTDLQRTGKEKIDFRVFERIILPCLLDGIKRDLPTYNRRIAQFDQMFYSSKSLFTAFKYTTAYPKEYFEPADFYKKEVDCHPDDQIAVDGLLHRIAWYLEYAIHELPEYGLVGELEDFASDLRQFKTYLQLSGNSNKWKKQVEKWELVQATWKNYIDNSGKYGTYEDYLKENHLSLD